MCDCWHPRPSGKLTGWQSKRFTIQCQNFNFGARQTFIRHLVAGGAAARAAGGGHADGYGAEARCEAGAGRWERTTKGI